MTQFGYRVTFDDSEIQTLQRALCHYLEVCRREIKKGGDVPFIAHRGTVKRFRAKVKQQLKLTQSFTLGEEEMDVSTRPQRLFGRMRTRDRKWRNRAFHCR